MNMRKSVVLLMLLLVAGRTSAQSNVVKGSITDTEGEAIVAAVVSLTRNDSTVMAYAITNNDGVIPRFRDLCSMMSQTGWHSTANLPTIRNEQQPSMYSYLIGG